jgi:hypothetical protein
MLKHFFSREQLMAALTKLNRAATKADASRRPGGAGQRLPRVSEAQAEHGQAILPSQALFRGLRCAVLIPCYNEEATVAGVVADFRVQMPWAEIHVYDNNSSDATALLAVAAGACVGREGRQGKGHVVRRMFAEIDADYYIMVDGDGTYAAQDSLQLLAVAIAGRCDLVNGRRPHEGRDRYRLGHTLGNKALTGLVGRLFGSGMDDMLSGSKVFSRRFVKSFPGLSRGFEIETDLTVHALGLDMVIAERPIGYGARPPGVPSKLNTVRDGMRILATIARLLRTERPLMYFSSLSAVLLATAFAIGRPALTAFAAGGAVQVSEAALALASAILGFGALLAGVVLDTVSLGRRDLRRLCYLMAANKPVRS